MGDGKAGGNPASEGLDPEELGMRLAARAGMRKAKVAVART
jgi:hypothetical protein